MTDGFAKFFALPVVVLAAVFAALRTRLRNLRESIATSGIYWRLQDWRYERLNRSLFLKHALHGYHIRRARTMTAAQSERIATAAAMVSRKSAEMDEESLRACIEMLGEASYANARVNALIDGSEARGSMLYGFELAGLDQRFARA